ncbi:FadR/GntR family transcriptional regulator [Anaerotalea alkaliphila]|uniref:FadR family transcriptional regulator n=1 Tax=Anaerotalea alkaliphila TaxID=2662126 RepID=A0A7X5HTN4_9FIRM|nr:FadR/GntR family transcriptional regulator [Anaerotalea alkaliphila]NDL66206.1 FadR family transcriptional regulator [Anaerotalea alkaliphila]
MYDKNLLSQKVAEDIRRMIKEKELKAGDKLPNELELTASLNVSRSTVREAIKILVSTNVLEVRRGKGTYVTSKPGLVKDPLGVSLMEKANLMQHLFESRLIMEPEIAALAAQRVTPQDREKLKKAYAKVSDDISQKLDHTVHDIAFHNEIAKSAHNPVIRRILPIINEGIRAGYAETKDLPESTEMVLKHHADILEAILEGNPDKAKEAMRSHIQYGLSQVMDHQEKEE